LLFANMKDRLVVLAEILLLPKRMFLLLHSKLLFGNMQGLLGLLLVCLLHPMYMLLY